ncbi:MAG TPA: NAD(P)H-dependent glycerol-3-phosphate dehydrogenase [Vicinamibacterales bacterium]|nr:NAD(P)H-dependent glycerol-3-phosphate dehydrogenase [Vicinamibacterales bacterium]
MKHAAVLGSGSWGTALSVHLAELQHPVRLWARDAALAREMRTRRANPVYLPDVRFPDDLRPTASLEEALAGAELVVVAIPSHGVAEVMRAAAPMLPPGATVVSATKGIDVESLMRVSELLERELQGACPTVVLSGPSFAVELARHLPTAVCVASHDRVAVERVQAEFRSHYLRLYATDDVIGVEVGGALKNVIAIAAGVVEGLGLGHNALAALITRGLAEIGRLATALGARRETLAGLAGLGDLVLTCTGTHSRNRHVGMELARGRSLPAIIGSMKMVAEGVRTTEAALALGARAGIELPITTQMAHVLSGRRSARDALGELMVRPQRAEPESG